MLWNAIILSFTFAYIVFFILIVSEVLFFLLTFFVINHFSFYLFHCFHFFLFFSFRVFFFFFFFILHRHKQSNQNICYLFDFQKTLIFLICFKKSFSTKNDVILSVFMIWSFRVLYYSQTSINFILSYFV